MTKKKVVSERQESGAAIFTVELTEDERGKLQVVADYYGRMGAGACLRWLLVEKYDELAEKRAGQAEFPSGDPVMFQAYSGKSQEELNEIIKNAVAHLVKAP